MSDLVPSLDRCLQQAVRRKEGRTSPGTSDRSPRAHRRVAAPAADRRRRPRERPRRRLIATPSSRSERSRDRDRRRDGPSHRSSWRRRVLAAGIDSRPHRARLRPRRAGANGRWLAEGRGREALAPRGPTRPRTGRTPRRRPPAPRRASSEPRPRSRCSRALRAVDMSGSARASRTCRAASAATTPVHVDEPRRRRKEPVGRERSASLYFGDRLRTYRFEHPHRPVRSRADDR